MEGNWTGTIILLVVTVLTFAAYVKWIFGYWKRKNIPYLEPSFPMGNFENIWALRNGMHETMENIYKEMKKRGYKHGGIFSSLRPIYIPVDLDIVKNIMIKDFQHFTDRGVYHNEKHEPMSMQLFRAEGARWKRLRTKLSPTFTSGRMKNMFHLVLGCGEAMGEEIKKLHESNKPVNIKEMSALYTTNVIGTCAFGLNCNCFENPQSEFRFYARKFFDGSIGQVVRRYAYTSFPNLCKILRVRIFPKETTDFFRDVIRKLIDYRMSTDSKRNDFVDLLLQVNEKAKTEEERFTFNEMAAQSFIIFLAGFETSSSTMTFALYEMSKNQEIQNRVRGEVRRVLAKHDGKLTYEAIMEMTYMGQVFEETLRKYPVLAILDRVCTKDYKMPGEDFILRKGEKIMIPLMGIHHDPEYYPDPEKFDPERFTPENKAKRHPCAFMPFGEGPRICIGLRFGIMQAKIGMSILLKDYMYTLNPKTPKLVMDSTTPMLIAPLGDVLLDIKKAL